MLDLVLKNGKIVNGTGNPWFYGDIGIKGSEIVEIVRISETAAEILDVNKKVICPGFIDVHSHLDIVLFDNPLGEIKLRQGVTTEIYGNCGFSPAPMSLENRKLFEDYSKPILGELKETRSWTKFGDYMEALRQLGPSHNISCLVGNGALRVAVKGFINGAVSSFEMKRIKELLAEGMEAGALGLSLGLMYIPENYYSTEELADICSMISDYNGIVAVHMRGEGSNLIDSISEIVYLAQMTNAKFHISHFKAAGSSNWGRTLERGMEILEKARKDGLDITCDVYPYNAGSTTMMSLLPPWAVEGGVEKTLERIADAKSRNRIERELNNECSDWDNMVFTTGWDRVMISWIDGEDENNLIGKSVGAVAGERGQTGARCALDLLYEYKGNIRIVFFHMSEVDVEKVITWDKSFIASDSIYSSMGNPHPRLYGTFPRVIARYVNDRGVLGLEEAIRKMTSYPAQRFGLKKRGLLLPGFIADIVVFDERRINDTATYSNPRNYPEGINMVLVGGKKTIVDGVHTGLRNGSFIERMPA